MEKELLNLILFEIREVKGDMSEVKGRLTNLETDMSEVKTRLTNVECRLTNVEKDMLEVKIRLTNVEKDMLEVKTRLTNVETDMSEVKGRLSNVEDLAKFNKETSESIRNVVTSHYMEFKKYIKSNNVQHNLYNAKLLEYKKEN